MIKKSNLLLEKQKELLQNELSALRKINNPNVIKLLEY